MSQGSGGREVSTVGTGQSKMEKACRAQRNPRTARVTEHRSPDSATAPSPPRGDAGRPPRVRQNSVTVVLAVTRAPRYKYK